MSTNWNDPFQSGAMKHLLPLIFAIVPSPNAAEFCFQHHFVNRDLPTDAKGTGDYGLTALADLDRDGDIDFVLGGRGVKPPRLYWFEYRGVSNWVQHVVGTNYQSARR